MAMCMVAQLVGAITSYLVVAGSTPAGDVHFCQLSSNIFPYVLLQYVVINKYSIVKSSTNQELGRFAT